MIGICCQFPQTSDPVSERALDGVMLEGGEASRQYSTHRWDAHGAKRPEKVTIDQLLGLSSWWLSNCC